MWPRPDLCHDALATRLFVAFNAFRIAVSVAHPRLPIDTAPVDKDVILIVPKVGARARHRTATCSRNSGPSLGWKNNFGKSVVSAAVSALKRNQCKAEYNQ
jgi:hypothetical protein